MGKRLNERFLAAYITLDKDCADKFGVATGGLTEYINRLNNARFAPGREDVLPRLVRYRSIRNKLAHELGSLRKMNEVTGADISWIRGFDRDLLRRRDPISAYLKRARRYARRRKVQRYLALVGVSVLVILGVILYFVLSK